MVDWHWWLLGNSHRGPLQSDWDLALLYNTTSSATLPSNASLSPFNYWVGWLSPCFPVATRETSLSRHLSCDCYPLEHAGSNSVIRPFLSVSAPVSPISSPRLPLGQFLGFQDLVLCFLFREMWFCYIAWACLWAHDPLSFVFRVLRLQHHFRILSRWPWCSACSAPRLPISLVFLSLCSSAWLSILMSSNLSERACIKNKVAREWERHPTSTCGFHMHILTEKGTQRHIHKRSHTPPHF